MLNCAICGGKKWLAKINKRTGEQEYHHIKTEETEYDLMVYRCWRCGNVQEEVAPYIPTPSRGASILYLDIEVSKSMLFNYGLRVPSKYISPDNLIHEYYIICWSASYMGSDKVWHDCVTPSEARRWTDKEIFTKIHALIKSADILAGHNIDSYDIKRLNTRFLLNGLEPIIGKKTYDTLKIARQKFAFESNRLDDIRKRLGFRPKEDITNEDWLKIVTSGDKETLKKVDNYCQSDVTQGKLVLDKLMKYAGKRVDYGSVSVK